MKRRLAFLGIVLLVAITFARIGSMNSKNSSTFSTQRQKLSELELEQSTVLPEHYVSNSNQHKLKIDSKNLNLYREILSTCKVSNDQDYGSFRILTVDTDAINKISTQADIHDEMNVITLNGYLLDTTKSEQVISSLPSDFVYKTVSSENFTKVNDTKLYVVQFVGPIRSNWYKQLAKTGTNIINYVANNGYIVQANSEQLKKIKDLRSGKNEIIQYVGYYQPAFKVSPVLRSIYKSNLEASVEVTVQIVDGFRNQETLLALKDLSVSLVRDAHKVLNYQNITLAVPSNRLAEISQLDSVFSIAPYYRPELMDERQGQIMAGNISGSLVNGPGYLNWLNTKGFSGSGQFGFVVDVTDDGIDRGSTTDVNNEFRVNGVAGGTSRVAYVNNYTGDSLGDGAGGHGNLNCSIIFGYNSQAGSSFQDAAAYNYGLGIAPWVRVGSSKVFSNDPNSSDIFNQPATVRLRIAYNAGARISSNSWGVPAFDQFGNYRPSANQYDAEAQEHDTLVRDADSIASGNQELTIVFAAGNDGARGRSSNTVSTPSTAKNVITVGANENDRQTGTDGCSTSNTGANNVNDVIDFSSRGPTSDGRMKPDIGAPGTHIQGAASRSASYNGGGVCNQYWPAGQTLYAWSSGTSHATPGIAGAAALTRQYFINQGWGAPSPAMVKAYLTNSARYMNGVGANDTLPSKNQGTGSVNLGTGFDGISRVLLDESEVFTSSGQTYVTSGTIANTSKPFRVSLAWTDAPGPTTGNAWVNDLDLEVTVNGTTYRGNRFSGGTSISGGVADNKNNLESVFLPAGTSGSYTVTVRGTNIAGDGIPGDGNVTDQDFALVVYNGNVGGTPTPDFTIAATPSSRTLTAGSSTTFTVNIGSVDGFSDTVNFSTTGLPSGASTSFSPSSVNSSGSSTLTLTTSSTTPAGNYTISITGISGTLSHSTSISLTVQSGGGGGGSQTVTYNNSTPVSIPDNDSTGITSTINVPDSLTIQSVSVSVNISHTWRGDVRIDLVSPSGTTTRLKETSSDSGQDIVETYAPASFNGQNSAGIWQLRVSDLASVDVGTLNSWSITIVGTTGGGGGGGGSGDFSLSLSTPTGSWYPGSTYYRTIYVNRTGGFSGPVTLSYISSRSGIFSSLSADQNPITGSSTRLTFRVASGAATGPATITFTGTDGSGKQRTTTLNLYIY